MAKYPATHKAYTIRWKRGPHPRSALVAQWIEIGDAHVEAHAAKSRHRVRLISLPIGGFDGKIVLVPIGEKPEDLAALADLSDEEDANI